MKPDRLFTGQALTGSCPPDLTGVARDSRAVRGGEAFVAAGGETATQARNAAEAVTRGASAVLAETALPVDAPQLITPHARWAFARASAAAAGVDQRHPPLVAVTGSAGKSTTTHCAWWALGAGAARVGTIGWHDGSHEIPSKQTTPPPEELHAFLAALPGSCSGVAMEISSHAADQQRLAGLELAGLAFTGLGHDHLDYHKTVAAYFAAKLKVPRWLAAGALCVVNGDDPRAHAFAHAARAAGGWPVGLGFVRGDCLIAPVAGRDGRAWRLIWNGVDHPLPVLLPGRFNAWNAAAGALLAHAAGVPLPTALARLADLPAVPGRLELLAREPLTYVDYAHTPEALAAMLGALREEFPGRRLVCVFGCGGDRDPTKRAPMGRAALAADIAVLTTDNSRSESPRAIAEQVVAGVDADVVWRGSEERGAKSEERAVGGRKTLHVQLDRAAAIVLARDLTGPDGIVVVAGKGHETNQEIQGRVLAWDDRSFVAGLGGMGAQPPHDSPSSGRIDNGSSSDSAGRGVQP